MTGDRVRGYPLAFTARGGTDPIGHAATGTRRGSTNRSRFMALCGAPIVRGARGKLFNPLHPRACRKCAKKVPSVAYVPWWT